MYMHGAINQHMPYPRTLNLCFHRGFSGEFWAGRQHILAYSYVYSSLMLLHAIYLSTE